MSFPKSFEDVKYCPEGPEHCSGCMKVPDLIQALIIAVEALRWTAQTVHQAHHSGAVTWENCGMGICAFVQNEMSRIEELGK
jgi:hypothetical protein